MMSMGMVVGASVLMMIVFGVVLGVVIGLLARFFAGFLHNSKQPVEPIFVKVTGKRQNPVSGIYYVTFEASNGARQEFKLPVNDYGVISEGDEGTLTYQGSRFVGFERKIQ